MNRAQHAWFAVTPWAQVVIPGPGAPWTVLPYTGRLDTATALVRELWRPPFERRIIHPHPFEPATLLEPDLPEAVALLSAELGAVVLETEDPAGLPALTVHAPVLNDLILIGQHLSRHHAEHTERLALHVRSLADRQQYHAGLHQQVAMYPLPRPHWHR